MGTNAYAVKEILDRQYIGGSTVTNCVMHMNLSILNRPNDCKLCQADVRNTLSRAINANGWLNKWVEDMKQALSE